jgi:hypothetical protein
MSITELVFGSQFCLLIVSLAPLALTVQDRARAVHVVMRLVLSQLPACGRFGIAFRLHDNARRGRPGLFPCPFPVAGLAVLGWLARIRLAVQERAAVTPDRGLVALPG